MDYSIASIESNPWTNLTGSLVSTSTSVSQYVAILEKFGIEGPHHHNRVSLENSNFYTRIGEGAQFTVFKSISGFGLRDIVLKRANLAGDERADKETQQRRLRALELEVSSLCNVKARQHPNIVKLTAWGYDYSNQNHMYPLPVLYVEQAFCSLKDLLRIPDGSSSCGLSMVTRLQICFDVASGLECVRNCNLVHGDLKPDNVLIFKCANGVVPYLAKLADFGLSIPVEHDVLVSFSRYRGTDCWRPPETLAGAIDEKIDPKMLFKCDSYSYGLVALSTLALKNGMSPLGNSDRKHANLILEDVCLALEGSLDLSTIEKEIAKKYSFVIQRHFLSDFPEQRSDVTSDAMRDLGYLAYSPW